MFLLRSFLNSKPILSNLNYAMRYSNNNRIIASLHNQSQIDDIFWKKNHELKRPISPFTIYKIQITSFMSFLHRSTGIGLSIPLYTFGISQFFINEKWENQLSFLHDYCPNLFLTIKFLCISSLVYHFYNGIRHLVWDLGKGYSLKKLYFSGYLVLALTFITTGIIFSKI